MIFKNIVGVIEKYIFLILIIKPRTLNTVFVSLTLKVLVQRARFEENAYQNVPQISVLSSWIFVVYGSFFVLPFMRFAWFHTFHSNISAIWRVALQLKGCGRDLELLTYPSQTRTLKLFLAMSSHPAQVLRPSSFVNLLTVNASHSHSRWMTR